MQTTAQLLMIRPVNFGFNAETAVNNVFQVKRPDDGAQQKALQEFENFVALLESHGISVTVINDTPEPHTPDSIFPNNWISFHPNHTICLYPMFAVNRRLERDPGILKKLEQQFGIREIIDFSEYEKQSLFLEGTGSMVLDRENLIAYACLSARTDIEVLHAFCKKLKYTPVPFHATDETGNPIYHTNVMMCIADAFAVICLDSIKEEKEKRNVIQAITQSGKELVAISRQQMNCFAGNMLQVNNRNGNTFLVMSSQAYHALAKDQIRQLEKYSQIIHAPLDTIETNGGGSARCMIAEVFT